MLLQLANANPEIARRSERPAVAAALAGNTEAIETALAAEEQDERRRDRDYWTPLKRELEALRLARQRDEPL